MLLTTLLYYATWGLTPPWKAQDFDVAVFLATMVPGAIGIACRYVLAGD